ncbi:MAG: Dam family site-specific DNA-(adenine-N6)-methyltransferase [Bacillota bacterium]|nr:Dam family site-specific DNA-(adenine-N6)-methyltransferase [Bacillota bacterium]
MNSIIGWVGGKKQLRNEIISLFPENFNMYVEVFGGAAWVLLGKEKHAKEEVYNDYNKDLVNLFRCVKYHRQELEKELELTLSSRENFNYFKDLLALDGLTDIQRAATFFYLIRLSFGNKGANYATRGKSLKKQITMFRQLATRFEKVVVENKDFEELIKLYDRSDTLFYLDPPYLGTENYYNNARQKYFTSEDHIRLKNALSMVKGKFLLSYNDCEVIRDLYSEYDIIEVKRKETLSTTGNNKKDYGELLIKNY